MKLKDSKISMEGPTDIGNFVKGDNPDVAHHTIEEIKACWPTLWTIRPWGDPRQN